MRNGWPNFAASIGPPRTASSTLLDFRLGFVMVGRTKREGAVRFGSPDPNAPCVGFSWSPEPFVRISGGSARTKSGIRRRPQSRRHAERNHRRPGLGRSADVCSGRYGLESIPAGAADARSVSGPCAGNRCRLRDRITVSIPCRNRARPLHDCPSTVSSLRLGRTLLTSSSLPRFGDAIDIFGGRLLRLTRSGFLCRAGICRPSSCRTTR